MSAPAGQDQGCRFGWMLGGLLGVNLLTRLIVAARPLEFIDGLTVPDDAYLSLTLARNIARGLGPLYGAEYTNGFQPFYVFLCVPFYWLWPTDPLSPVRAALVLLALFDTLALYLLWRLAELLTRARWLPPLLAVSWALNPYVIGTSLNGMETVIAFSLIAAVFHFFYRHYWFAAPWPATRRHWALGGLVGLAIFARIDAIVLAPAIVSGLAAAARRQCVSWRRLIGALATISLAATAVLAPWLLYSWHYTGLLYPISGRAVRLLSLFWVDGAPTFQGFYGPEILLGWRAVTRAHRFDLGLIVLLALGLMILNHRRPWRQAWAQWKQSLVLFHPALVFSVILFFAYTTYGFGSWFYLRYLFPVALPIMLAWVMLADGIAARIASRRARRGFALALLVVIAGARLSSAELPQLFLSKDKRTLGYMNLGLWARGQFPDGTKIGAPQSGALAYFAENLEVFNLDGVVSATCYRWLAERRAMQYIRWRGIDYVVAWPLNIRFLERQTADFKPDDLVHLYDVAGFESWGRPWSVYRVGPPPAPAR